MIDGIGSSTISQQQVSSSGQQVEKNQQTAQDNSQLDSSEQKNVQSEELLSQIKSLTEDGLLSVRFEKDDASEELVVKVVNQETDEVVRQIPPEELLNLSRHLKELSGNIVETIS